MLPLQLPVVSQAAPPAVFVHVAVGLTSVRGRNCTIGSAPASVAAVMKMTFPLLILSDPLPLGEFHVPRTSEAMPDPIAATANVPLNTVSGSIPVKTPAPC